MTTMAEASTAIQQAIARLQREADELAARERAASARRQELAALADGVAGRIVAIDVEAKQLTEIAAHSLVDGKPFDPTILARLGDTRQALMLELPVRRRAAELATQQLNAIHLELNAARERVTNVMLASGRRVVR
jgi:hypothetical protein